jgi:hypothetical protein
MLPINQPHGLLILTGFEPKGDAVAQEAVNIFVPIVQRLAGVGGGLLQFVEHLADQGIAVAAFLQPRPEQLRFDIAVALAFFPVAEIRVAETERVRLIREQPRDAPLGLPLLLADGANMILILQPLTAGVGGSMALMALRLPSGKTSQSIAPCDSTTLNPAASACARAAANAAPAIAGPGPSPGRLRMTKSSA